MGAAAAAILSIAPVPGLAQVSTDERAATEEAERQRAITRTFAANARQLTIFDRGGRVVGTLGDRDLFNQPVFSPDRSHVAVIRIDLRTETNDLWVFDVTTGEGTQITENAPRLPLQAPAWSPDGRYVAYTALRDSYFGLYRAAANGEGDEELIYRHEGGPIVLTDWSLDGRFLSFYATDLAGSALYLFDLDGGEVIEAASSDSALIAARLSPDSRFLAYLSDETGRDEIFVRAVAAPGETGTGTGGKWQVSTDGGLGMVHWRRDGRELYYLGPGRRVMAVAVDTTGDAFEFDAPRLLMRAPDSIPAGGRPGALGNVSKDGERVIFAVPPSQPLRQIAVLDRGGEVVARVGEPGRYFQPKLSPDGSKVAVLREDLRTGNVDVWAFDVATGMGTRITDSDRLAESDPIWTPGGEHVAYSYFDDETNATGIYRKPWNGSGSEELLFRWTPGAFLSLTDFSPDAKYLTFDGGGFILTVPLSGDAASRKAIDYSREEFEVGAARFSPDARFMAYGSNETGRFEIYVRPFDAATGMAPDEGKWQISRGGANGAVSWRQDGKELLYVREKIETPQLDDVEVIAVDVTTTPSFEVLDSRVLFELSIPPIGDAPASNASADGQRFVFTLPVTD